MVYDLPDTRGYGMPYYYMVYWGDPNESYTDPPWDNMEWYGNADGYRLPTSTEWELAAKAEENYNYSGSNDINDAAWYDDNSLGTTHSVGTKNPNSNGLYDMSGNVHEWCWDWPWGSSTRIYRGGSYASTTSDCLITAVNSDSPGFSDSTIGLRTAKTLVGSDYVIPLTITYNSNNGSGQTITQDNIWPNSQGTLMSNTFLRLGYTFWGWSLSANGSVAYADEEIITIGTADLTLYAVWAGNPYTVSFNANGGSGGQTIPVIATFGQPMPNIGSNIPINGDDYFVGYFDVAETMYYNANLFSVSYKCKK